MRLRWFPAALVLVVLLVPGCLTAERAPVSEGGDEAVAGAEPAPVLPENFTREEEVVGATPLSPLLSSSACGDAASGLCYRYEVELVDPAVMTATLSWQTQTNDFDVYLLKGDQVVADSKGYPPGTEESVTASLEPGTYGLMVVAYLVKVDTFRLDAVFTSV